jgi:monofunctional biosynthetic peptidoglycan transglycosylase
MKVVKSSVVILFQVVGIITVIFLMLGFFVFSQFPSSSKIKGCMVTKMYQVNLCPGSPQYVRIDSVSEYLKKSIIISEDAGFYGHKGFDVAEMQKSLEKNISAGKFARGGSTITQQLAKNLFLSKDKTLIRKGMEALITMQIERTLSKNEILERYVNVVQFGKELFGVKAAASFYFKKSPSQLDPVESAFLAFLLPSPEAYSKSFFKKELTPFAQKRIREILGKLYSVGKISEPEYASAMDSLPYFLTGQKPSEEILEDLEMIDEESAPTEI